MSDSITTDAGTAYRDRLADAPAPARETTPRRGVLSRRRRRGKSRRGSIVIAPTEPSAAGSWGRLLSLVLLGVGGIALAALVVAAYVASRLGML